MPQERSPAKSLPIVLRILIVLVCAVALYPPVMLYAIVVYMMLAFTVVYFAENKFVRFRWAFVPAFTTVVVYLLTVLSIEYFNL